MTPETPPPLLRDQVLQSLQGRSHFPVVIVGAGINGLGVFHDLSLQGIDCLIVDQGDFCSGTSAAPSRMIHGGLKYLETGEFRLVRESVEERDRLLRNAPHLVKPLEMILPTRTAFGGEIAAITRFFGGKTKVKTRGRWLLKAGLAVYDYFSGAGRVAPKHRMLSGQELQALFPGISEGFRYAGSYFDAQIEMPERLGLELALDGMAANPGSLALNHCALTGLEDGRLALEDRIGGTQQAVSADVVVNAAGPWIDLANAQLGAETKLIAGNKGSHIMLDLPALEAQLRGRMLYFDPGDGRICLVTSLAGRVLLGSTDIPVTAPESRCADEEVDYMLAALRGLFPRLEVGREHIVFSYSGVRPLPANNADDPGDVSRDHRIDVAEAQDGRPFAVLSLVGGKWTTYRAFAAETADLVLSRLGAARKTDTEALAIGGGAGLSRRVEDWEALVAEVTGVCGDRARATGLVARYGRRALDVAAHLATNDPVSGTAEISRAEIAWMVREEMASTLGDVALRRLPMALSGRLSMAAIEALADTMADALNWTREQRDSEVEALLDTMLTRHRIDTRAGVFR